jgi:hypothetical protein
MGANEAPTSAQQCMSSGTHAVSLSYSNITKFADCQKSPIMAAIFIKCTLFVLGVRHLERSCQHPEIRQPAVLELGALGILVALRGCSTLNGARVMQRHGNHLAI